jgi:2-phosphoglycerate kinase
MNNIKTKHRLIFIFGVPGSGKSTLGELLSKKLRVPFLEVDDIKAIAQQGETIKSNPYYFLHTTEAYKALGARTPENVIQGLLNVRKAFEYLVQKEVLMLKNSGVVEGAFLDPNKLKDNGIVILLTIPSSTKHKKQFLVHRTKESLINGQFENARLFQEYLISEAKKLNLPILVNNGDMNTLVGKAMSHILKIDSI